jgi:hypothetical protein
MSGCCHSIRRISRHDRSGDVRRVGALQFGLKPMAMSAVAFSMNASLLLLPYHASNKHTKIDAYYGSQYNKNMMM